MVVLMILFASIYLLQMYIKGFYIKNILDFEIPVIIMSMLFDAAIFQVIFLKFVKSNIDFRIGFLIFIITLLLQWLILLWLNEGKKIKINFQIDYIKFCIQVALISIFILMSHPQLDSWLYIPKILDPINSGIIGNYLDVSEIVNTHGFDGYLVFESFISSIFSGFEYVALFVVPKILEIYLITEMLFYFSKKIFPKRYYFIFILLCLGIFFDVNMLSGHYTSPNENQWILANSWGTTYLMIIMPLIYLLNRKKSITFQYIFILAGLYYSSSALFIFPLLYTAEIIKTIIEKNKIYLKNIIPILFVLFCYLLMLNLLYIFLGVIFILYYYSEKKYGTNIKIKIPYLKYIFVSMYFVTIIILFFRSINTIIETDTIREYYINRSYFAVLFLNPIAIIMIIFGYRKFPYKEMSKYMLIYTIFFANFIMVIVSGNFGNLDSVYARVLSFAQLQVFTLYTIYYFSTKINIKYVGLISVIPIVYFLLNNNVVDDVKQFVINGDNTLLEIKYSGKENKQIYDMGIFDSDTCYYYGGNIKDIIGFVAPAESHSIESLYPCSGKYIEINKKSSYGYISGYDYQTGKYYFVEKDLNEI